MSEERGCEFLAPAVMIKFTRVMVVALKECALRLWKPGSKV